MKAEQEKAAKDALALQTRLTSPMHKGTHTGSHAPSARNIKGFSLEHKSSEKNFGDTLKVDKPVMFGLKKEESQDETGAKVINNIITLKLGLPPLGRQTL